MALALEEIEKLGELARLHIAPEDVDDLVAKLTSILNFVDQLKAVETASVDPMAHPLDRSQRLREDSVTESDQRDLYQQNAARVQRGLYLVPKVID